MQPRLCSFFAEGKCKRGSQCKLRHEKPAEKPGDDPRVFPTRWREYPVATMSEAPSGTWVKRPNVAQAMRNFMHVHGAPLRIEGTRQHGASTCIHLVPPDLSAIVQYMNVAQTAYVYCSHNREGQLQSVTADTKALKVTRQGGVPEILYHATTLWAGISAMVLGHLVARGPPTDPQACYFSERADRISFYEQGAMFEASVYGLYPGKKYGAVFSGCVVPLGIILHLDRKAGDWLACTYSHRLHKVWFKTDVLQSFLQNWSDVGEPRLCLPMPDLTTAPSFHYLAYPDPLWQPAMITLRAQQCRMEELLARYKEWKAASQLSLMASVPCTASASSQEPPPGLTDTAEVPTQLAPIRFIRAQECSGDSGDSDSVMGKRLRPLTQQEAMEQYGKGFEFLSCMGGLADAVFLDPERQVPDKAWTGYHQWGSALRADGEVVPRASTKARKQASEIDFSQWSCAGCGKKYAGETTWSGRQGRRRKKRYYCESCTIED